MNQTRYTLKSNGKYWQVLRGGDEQFELEKERFTRPAALAMVKRYNDGIPKFDMQQVTRIKFKVEGCASGEYVDCHALAKEAWGEQAKEENISAMAYLWRRFGPPWWGTDSHKRIASWVLATADPCVFLDVSPSASSMAFNVSYLMKRGTLDSLCGSPIRHRQWERKFERWFLKQNSSMPHKTPDELKALRELYGKWRFDGTRIAQAKKVIGPFPHRRYDVDLNGWRKGPEIVRRVNQALFDAMKELLRPVYVRDSSINIFGRPDDVEMPAAEPSIYAGLGVPRAAMEKLRKSDGKGT
jgi:hypothetical protein